LSSPRGRLALLTVSGLLLLLIIQGIPAYVLGAQPVSQGRILYFKNGERIFTFSKPTALIDANWTLPLPLQFQLPPILSSGASIAGGAPVSFSLWLSSNTTSFVQVQLQPLLLQVGSFSLGANQVSLNETSRQYNFTYAMPATGMQLYQAFTASVNFTFTSTSHTAVALHGGSVSKPSKVIIPFTNYASVQTVKITDYRGAENQTFNVQAPPNQNIVFLTADIRDIFGTGPSTDIGTGPSGDISLVNFTISGPQGPVNGEANRTMNLFCPQGQCPQPAQYQAYWVYPSSTSEATYSVTFNIIDSQGNVIRDTSGVHSFGIGRLPPPFPLLAALISGGGLGVAGLATGAVYLRRRRTKEYLAPFSFFEQMTGGEVPGGSMVTVEGNTGAGKTTLCSEVMYEDLKRAKPCIYVAADDFPDRIRDQMKNLGIDVGGYEKSGLLSFVDCYSAEAGRIPTEKFSVSSMGDLTTLGVKISSALQDQKGTCLYLDSLSPFVPRAKPESIVSFVHAIGAKVRGLDGKAFFTMSTGSDETIQRQMEDMADCVIQMEAFEEKDVRRRRLRIRKFRNRRHQEGWATFTIEDGKGIIFYTKKSRRSN